MARGHAPKREAKKSKKKDSKKAVLSTVSDTFTSAEVEVVRKRKKSKEEDF